MYTLAMDTSNNVLAVAILKKIGQLLVNLLRI